MPNKWIQRMSKMEGSVNERADAWANPLRSVSPSFNAMFSHTHGLPRGYSVLLWGKPKAGKSLLCYQETAGIHRDDPEGIVVKFDTEFRDEGQLTPDLAAAYGIDHSRYHVFAVSDPSMVFDRIKDEIGPMVDAGMPLRLIIIDSITGIQGMKDALQETKENAKAAMKTFNMGDMAQTTKRGLKMILPFQRAPGRPRVSLIVTAHAAAEMDMWEQKRGNKEKAAVSFGVQHHCEFFINVERVDNADGKKDASGREMVDPTRKSMDGSKGKGERTGHRIRAWMQASTMSIPDRTAEFTFDYRRGVINVHEEVFKLGTGWGIIKRDGTHYTIGDQRFNGKPAAMAALEKSPELQQIVLSTMVEMEKTASGFVPGDVVEEDAE